MQGTDRDDILLVRPHSRKATSRILFWLEMLVVAAGIAGSALLVGSDYSLVRSRQEVLSQYKENADFSYFRRSELPSDVAEHTANVSWLRRMLGDEALTMILLPRETTSSAELARVRAVFPEARVHLRPTETKRVNDRSSSSLRWSRVSG